MEDLSDIVRRERLRREWSVRKAAGLGGISNTYWGGFEDYKQPLTPAIVKAVATAYLWSNSWPAEKTVEHDPSLVVTRPPDGDPLVVALALEVERLAQRMDAMQDVVEEQRHAIASLQSSPQAL